MDGGKQAYPRWQPQTLSLPHNGPVWSIYCLLWAVKPTLHSHQDQHPLPKVLGQDGGLAAAEHQA